MRIFELTREASISNISNSVNRPLGFAFVFNGIPVYNRIVRTHRRKREPDTNQLISGDVGHTRIDDILDDVDIFSWNSVIPKNTSEENNKRRRNDVRPS